MDIAFFGNIFGERQPHVSDPDWITEFHKKAGRLYVDLVLNPFKCICSIRSLQDAPVFLIDQLEAIERMNERLAKDAESLAEMMVVLQTKYEALASAVVDGINECNAVLVVSGYRIGLEKILIPQLFPTYRLKLYHIPILQFFGR